MTDIDEAAALRSSPDAPLLTPVGRHETRVERGECGVARVRLDLRVLGVDRHVPTKARKRFEEGADPL